MKLTVKGLNITDGVNRLSLDEVSVELQASEINDVVSNFANLAKQFGFNAENISMGNHSIIRHEVRPVSNPNVTLQNDKAIYEILKSKCLLKLPRTENISINSQVRSLLKAGALNDARISDRLYDLVMESFSYMITKKPGILQNCGMYYKRIFGDKYVDKYIGALIEASVIYGDY